MGAVSWLPTTRPTIWSTAACAVGACAAKVQARLWVHARSAISNICAQALLRRELACSHLDRRIGPGREGGGGGGGDGRASGRGEGRGSGRVDGRAGDGVLPVRTAPHDLVDPAGRARVGAATVSDRGGQAEPSRPARAACVSSRSAKAVEPPSLKDTLTSP
jgi:hypothetical protein